jgi:alkylation response protein AidB-like acyl-CoA dehydrogenase
LNLKLDPAELEFQREVRAFIDRHWPAAVRTGRDDASAYGGTPSPAQVAWFRALVQRGWSVPHWPVAHGGTNWSPTQHYIWDRETAGANCPEMSAFGTKMLAPVLYTWGSQAQQAEHLPAIREARVTWCQGYSEPGAGSDLASLSTRAVRAGDQYIVNGAKTWTSGAHAADWMFCLVRTNPAAPKKQEGISFLLIDMRSPGIEVRPIRILGEQHTVNSVTLTDVRVPVANRVGEENRGWTYAKGLLAHERTGIAGVARSQAQLAQLKALATRTLESGLPLIENAAFARAIVEVEIELLALEVTELRALAAATNGGAPGPESSILKIRGSEIAQRIADLQIEALGYVSLPYPDATLIDNEGAIGDDFAVPALQGMMFGRAASIFGGSNEIQKNIIAKAVLGL